jgi:SAM-dependent methyltransferase
MAIDDATRIAVETCLLDHPDVAAASLMIEEAADGHSYPVAYVVPHPERMHEARMRIYRADKEKRVSQWRMAFDRTYRSTAEDPAPSFVGWTNSYTNRPLPESEMQDWLETTVDRILSFHPGMLLEIGCGVGLLVERVAPRCASYVGTDLSPVAIARLRDFVASRSELRHVSLFEREAVDLGDQPSGSVDTVVINSVIQYFPDIHYLQNVIDEAARIVRPGGRIIIGDVRHFGMLPLFHSAVQLAKAPPQASAQWLKRRVSLGVEHERELAIDPEFFLALPSTDRRICGVEVLLKRGKAHNELTRYRYDAILHVGEGELPASRSAAEWEAGDRSIAEIVAQIEAGRFTAATIRNVPNRRLASDIASARRLWSADDQELVGTLRDSFDAEPDYGIDPEDYWALSDMGLCDVRVSLSPGSVEGQFDVTLIACDQARGTSLPRWNDMPAPAKPRRLATDPLEAAYQQQLGPELHQLLRDRLPDGSLPAAVLAVGTLPSAEPMVSSGVSAHPLGDSHAAPRYAVSGAGR